MAWLRSVVGLVLAGLFTLAIFTSGPLLLMLGGIPLSPTVVVAPEREGLFLPLSVGDPFAELDLAMADQPSDDADADATENGEGPGDEGGSSGEGTPDGVADGTPSGDDSDGASGGEADGRVARGIPGPTQDPNRERNKKGGHNLREEAIAAGGGKVKRKRGCEPKPIPQIKKMGADTWLVERGLVRGYAGSIKKVNKLGWSKQHRDRQGKVDGMTIGGIRCNNDLHRAGLRSGDVVHTVNGLKVKNLVQAMLVYARVRNDRVLKLQISRKGKRKMLTYRMKG